MSQHNDSSTIDVIKWLIYYNVPYVRIDREDVYKLKFIEITSNEPNVIIQNINNGKIINLNSISCYWYRRGELNLVTPKTNGPIHVFIKTEIDKYLHQENKKIVEYIYDYLGIISKINDYKMNDLNKLNVLRKALQQGLKIPKTYVISNSENKEATMSGEMICKSISDPFHINLSRGNFTSYTEKIDVSIIQGELFPSLIQNHIDKEADIRSFYLFGKFYCMAILSQSNDQTKVDFRKYSTARPNRKVPFKLPIEIENKLNALMNDLELESGSVDLILCKDNTFIFLEVNPIGQFGMTSYPCNYYIEREIASQLKEFYQSNNTNK